MKKTGLYALCTLFLAVPGYAADERTAEDALGRARSALHDAVEALAEAGRLSLDKQLPKLREQTDQTLQESQKLLKQWEGRLRQEMDKQKEKNQENQPPPPGTEKPGTEPLPRI